MRVLLISTLIYLSGVVVVLYLRPEIMFHKDGRWKEFGLHVGDATVFPFWMFCIAWALVSYFMSGVVGQGGAAAELTALTAIASAGTPFSGVAESTIRTVAKNNLVQEVSEEEDLVRPLPVPTLKKRGGASLSSRMRGGGGGGKPKRGYYLYVGDDSDGGELAAEE